MPKQATTAPTGGLSTVRIEALSDGVFAIAMTLLVLEMHVPRLEPEQVASGLTPALLKLGPSLLAYVVSFVLLGTLWVGQSFQFHWIRRSDRTFLWIHLGFLMCICFLPFSAALLSEYGSIRQAALIYGVNLLLAGTFLDRSWHYAVGRGLVARQLSAEARHAILLRTRGGFLVYALATLAAFVAPWLSLIGFVAVPIAYILPGRVDRHLPTGESD
jgi:uncharacterized membrane protein